MSRSKSRSGKGRRARGTGTIFFHAARGQWVGRKQVGHTAAGNPKYVERWGDTQAEVVRKLALAAPPGPDVTVAAYAARWLAALRLRPGTLRDYGVSVTRHITPHLGPVRVRDVTTGRVEAFALAIRDGRSPNTVNKVLAHLRTMLGAAVRAGLLATNPVAAAKKPRRVRKKVEPYPPADLARVIDTATRTGRPVVALLAATGCRLGEAAALDVPDWDERAGTVTVSKTHYREHGAGPPKTERGARTITVPAAAVPALRLARAGETTGPLFRTGSGGRAHHVSVRTAVRAVLRAAGLPVRNPHQLRHSVATALISSNAVPLGDVAKYLGDSVETVVKTYLHPTGSDPAVTLDVLLGGRKVGGGAGGGGKSRKKKA